MTSKEKIIKHRCQIALSTNKFLFILSLLPLFAGTLHIVCLIPVLSTTLPSDTTLICSALGGCYLIMFAVVFTIALVRKKIYQNILEELTND